MYMPMMMKKLLYIDTKTVCINIFKVACFPMMVKLQREARKTCPWPSSEKIPLVFKGFQSFQNWIRGGCLWLAGVLACQLAGLLAGGLAGDW